MIAGLVCAGACTPRVHSDSTPPRVAVASASATATAPSPPSAPRELVGGARPTELFVPPSYRAGTPTPLVLMLHAYGVDGALEEWFFKLKPWAKAKGFLYVAPDGTTNGKDRTYWNATDACCAPQLATGQPPEPDDEKYLLDLLDEVAAKFTVDPRRVYVVGHSNGGFMAHRLACHHPERFAAIVSVAGATYADPKRCQAASPVALLQIHGTADATIRYDGGAYYALPYPGAKATAERWAGLDGCASAPVEGAPLDIDASIDGPETRVLRWGSCRAGSAVELWTIEGGSHVPTPTSELARGIVEFLFAHPRS